MQQSSDRHLCTEAGKPGKVLANRIVEMEPAVLSQHQNAEPGELLAATR